MRRWPTAPHARPQNGNSPIRMKRPKRQTLADGVLELVGVGNSSRGTIPLCTATPPEGEDADLQYEASVTVVAGSKEGGGDLQKPIRQNRG